MTNKILVVAAHPDDEILGCAGTLMKRKNDGDQISILILGEGLTARLKNRNIDRKCFDTLYGESEKVAEFIGAEDHLILGFPDNRFDTVARLDIVKSIERIKDKVNPNIIYTHFCNDLNVDHKITFEAVMTATRPQPTESVEEIYCFETPSATEYVFGNQGKFSPNVFCDIGGYINKKIKAVEIYKSEMKDCPHPRSLEYVRNIASVRGMTVGVEFAEAFELVRKIC